jgi:hypothetical protein
MQPTPRTQGTLAELVDPEFAIEPQWMDPGAAPKSALSETTRAELSNEPQWIVWSDPASEAEWAESELDHLIGRSH